MIYEEGNYYHIYNRGCNKEKIFFCSENYEYLIRRMKKNHKEYFVNIIAFCLMPNHFHFLLQQKSNIPLSDWLKVLFSGYTLAVNKQHNRTGTLFEGKLKKRMIDKTEYLQHLIYYIHFNPVKADLVFSPEEWKFSNYLECIDKRDDSPFDELLINEYFGSKEKYMIFTENYYLDERTGKQLRKYLID
ncbi:MAG: transposase [Candidatus Cloacimonetes bacterium]|nr:transposase [Candidatus Cloacimonadota bacterium]MBL7149925.1 transposase [Candidatus Cloacimonadota bacterium]